MTFLLQKSNAINRTRTEARVRNGLRPTAGGIAFTGRLAACLLLAGFLGVGSAMAQPKVLRVGGGPITVNLETDEFPGVAGSATDWGVHHYQIGTMTAVDLTVDDMDADTTPASMNNSDDDASFLVGRHALVSISAGMLTINPIAPGAFKIAVDPVHDQPTDEEDETDDALRPVFFEIMSANAPQIGTRNNAASQMAANTVALQLRDKTSAVPEQLKNLNVTFTDPNDVFLTYTASADKVGGTAGMRRPVAEKGEAILSVSTAGAKLTIGLTAKAKAGDVTDVWVWATDTSGEYARWQVPVSVGVGSAPYVVSAMAPGDMILREGALADKPIPLTAVFLPGVAPTPNPTGVGGTLDAYKVEISDASAASVGMAPDLTYIIPSMVATVSKLGHLLTIRPRSPGSLTFTVTATDKGSVCHEGDANTDPAIVEEVMVRALPATTTTAAVAAYCFTDEAMGSATDVMGYTGTVADDVREAEVKAADKKEVDSQEAQFRFAQSASHSFTVTVVSRTTPEVFNAITAPVLDADGEAKTVDLADVDAKKTGVQAAFKDATGEGLTYTVSTSKADSAKVIATVDSSVVTLMPVWGTGGSAVVKLKATNNLDESSSTTFSVKVNTATKPVVNPLVRPALALGFMLNTGDEALVLNLVNLLNAKEAKNHVSLFIDPDANPKDALLGGLLLKMQVVDVVADHVYVNQSKENDVSTSAMRLVLDPAAATLTVTPTAASSATVTVWGIDRDRNMISATTTITVMSGVGTESEELPTEVALSQNYPNPFNPQTTIDYALPKASDVSLIVYDMLGREVDVLLDGPQAAGRHTVRFGANHLPNGTYVYRLVAADKTITRTMVLVK